MGEQGNMKRKLLTAALATALGLGVLAGCTPEARDKYGDATENLSDAVGTDLEKTGQAIQERSARSERERSEHRDDPRQTQPHSDATADPRRDTTVEGRVQDEIRNDPQLRTQNIHIESLGERIILRGEVETDDERRRVEEIVVRNVPTGTIVENRIEVRPNADRRTEGTTFSR
jgi:hypothetical protein